MIRAFALTAALAATQAAAEDRALVIGIDDYSALPGAPALNGAVADTARMTEALAGPLGFAPGAVTRLTDDAASYDAILSTIIDQLVGGTRAGDRVVLYFAGMGTTLPDGQPALLAHDADTALGKIPLAVISDILELIADRQVTVMLDTGFDGGPIGARGIAGAVPTGPAAMGRNTTLWTAAGPGEFAWEELDRGVFTAAWTAALTDPAADTDGDGTLSNGEVLAAVSASLPAWCDATPACLAAGRGLTPAFTGDAGAPLAALPKAPQIVAPLAPLVPDDGAPASYLETLGFVTDLFAPSNAANLALSINDGKALRVGDTVSFTATATRPGTLVLLDVDPNGSLAQVYPSSLAADGGTRLSPGQPLTIPNAIGANGKPLRIRVTEPAGQGLLLGLFIEGDLPQLTGLLPAGIAGGPVPNAGQALFEISQSLLRLEADPANPVAWSATYLPYRIEK